MGEIRKADKDIKRIHEEKKENMKEKEEENEKKKTEANKTVSHPHNHNG